MISGVPGATLSRMFALYYLMIWGINVYIAYISRDCSYCTCPIGRPGEKIDIPYQAWSDQRMMQHMQYVYTVPKEVLSTTLSAASLDFSHTIRYPISHSFNDVLAH